MISADVVIIGTGIAGAATAYYLTRCGVTDVILLEQEAQPGMHASGRNAGLIHGFSLDPAMASILSQGVSFLNNPPNDLRVPLIRTGSLFLASGDQWQQFQKEVKRFRSDGFPVEPLSAEEAKKKAPPLEGADFEGALFNPMDGVVDTQSLLASLLDLAKEGGARVYTSSKVLSIQTQNQMVTGVSTPLQTFKTSVVINAAGAWASEVGQMTGAVSIPFSNFRRHLFQTEPVSGLKNDWPFVWDYNQQVYFRPDGDRLILSPCDEVEHPAGIPKVSDEMIFLLREKMRKYPWMNDLPIASSWAGIRTVAPDRRFVIGWDPLIAGFFWVAGLGGYGVTAGGAIGQLVADLIGGVERKGTRHFSPERFVKT